MPARGSPSEPPDQPLTPAGRAYIAAAMPDGPGETNALDWRVLNDEVQVASFEGRVVALIYMTLSGYNVKDGEHVVVYELCWLPVSGPEHSEVLFGVTEGSDWWDARWTRARQGVENLLAYEARRAAVNDLRGDLRS
jgi:hypothetical protein